MNYKAGHYIQDPLEKCLRRKIIDKAGYIAGLRLRWLSSLQVSNFRLINHQLSRLFTKSCRLYRDMEWNIDRLKEYQYIEKELRYSMGCELVYAVCIYQHNPSFLEIDLLRKSFFVPVFFCLFFGRAFVFF